MSTRPDRPGDGTGPRFVDYVSDILVFTSTDGYHYEYGYTVASSGIGSALNFEDPRVQWVEDRGIRRLVMTYTHVPPPGEGPWRIGAHRLCWDSQRYELEEATGQLLGPPGVANKDAVVFTLSDNRVALIHRIHPDMQLAVFDDLEHLWHAGPDYWDAYMADLDVHTLIRLTPGALGVGAGAPRVRTEAGFLLFFHERPPTAHTRSTWRCWTRSLVDCRAASPNRYSSRSSTGSSGAMWTTSSSPGSALRR